MTEIIVAMIGFFAMTSAALIEKVRRDNKRDHGIVAMKLDLLAKGLGHSLDRVRETADRTELKIDDHMTDHAKGAFK
jgi:hypothetical protein